MRVAAGMGLGKLEPACSKRKWISQAGHTQEVWTDLSKSKTDWACIIHSSLGHGQQNEECL